MTRPLPQDLGALAGAESAPRAANAALRMLHWAPFGDDFAFGAGEDEARERVAIDAFMPDSPARKFMDKRLARVLARDQERCELLERQGWVVRSVRMPCVAPVLPRATEAGSGKIGLVLHWLLGLPMMAPAVSRHLMRQAAAHAPQAWPEGSPTDERERQELVTRLYGTDTQPGSVLVFDALCPQVPILARRPRDPRWETITGPVEQPTSLRFSDLVLCASPGSEIEFRFAAKSEADAELAVHQIGIAMDMWGLTGRALVEEAPPAPPPEEYAEEYVEEQPAEYAYEEEYAEQPYEAEEYQEPLPEEEQYPPAPADAGPAPLPADVPTITVRVPTVQYLPNNGRVVVMFLPPGGRDAMKAEEHITAIYMPDELRARLKKKKSLAQVDVEVEAVGNSWKIRGLSAAT